MTDGDETELSAEESISDEISERIRSVLAAAESAATAIRHEAEQQAQLKSRATEQERQRLLEDTRAEAEALLEARVKRISELSDAVIEAAESILMRIEGAQEVKRQLETMVHALAHAAEDLASESDTKREAVRPRPVALDDGPEPQIQAVPEPEPQATVTELHAAEDPAPAAEPEVAVAETETAVAEPETPDEPQAAAEGEVVDAVEVVDAEPEIEKPSPVERLRKAAAARVGNGAKEEQAPAGEQRGFDGDDMLAARLVALQMAVAGSARSEVEDHLRKTFSLDEPSAILNDVFGTETKL